jgi:CheY-like chemotaxis protein
VAAERWAAAERRAPVHAAPASAGCRAERSGGAGEAADADRVQSSSEASLKQLRGSRDDDRGARPRILVIDDDEQLCDIIRESLQDYAVACARHGAAALELVTGHSPAVILLDLRMPIMDGWSFVQQYRKVASVPAAIVVMSAAPDLPAIASQLGADGHLQKPFDLDDLNACVATQLKSRSTNAPNNDPPAR